MMELGEELRFALEPRQALFVLGEFSRKDFDRDLALQPGVGRAVDLPHAAFAQLGGDLVGAEALSDHRDYGRPAKRFRSASCQWSTTVIGGCALLRLAATRKRWPSPAAA